MTTDARCSRPTCRPRSRRRPSATRTTVHLLRHGEVHNPEGVLYGRLPSFRLSEDGQQMARDAAEALRGRDITVVVASPLQRAQETARPTAEAFGLEIRTDERLIESENVFEGKTVGVGDGAFSSPANWKHMRNPFRPSWGEPYQQIAERMLAAVEAARDLARGHEAVCVSHQLPIWTVRRYVEGRKMWHRPDRRQCGLASLTSLTWIDDRLQTVTYSEPAGAVSRRPGAGA
jgi:broad specificity phosphatase PhoE